MNGIAWYELGMTYHALHRTDKVRETIAYLHEFEPKMTIQLMHETGVSLPDRGKAPR